MIERDGNGNFQSIRCETCGVVAPPTSDIIINHGLNNMGWKCTGGTHYCPDHHPDVHKSGPRKRKAIDARSGDA